ncbi:MAG: hypothetical protein ACFFD4_20555 [Candidatus Odinarchaeota archaeon]
MSALKKKAIFLVKIDARSLLFCNLLIFMYVFTGIFWVPNNLEFISWLSGSFDSIQSGLTTITVVGITMLAISFIIAYAICLVIEILKARLSNKPLIREEIEEVKAIIRELIIGKERYVFFSMVILSVITSVVLLSRNQDLIAYLTSENVHLFSVILKIVVIASNIYIFTFALPVIIIPVLLGFMYVIHLLLDGLISHSNKIKEDTEEAIELMISLKKRSNIEIWYLVGDLQELTFKSALFATLFYGYAVIITLTTLFGEIMQSLSTLQLYLFAFLILCFLLPWIFRKLRIHILLRYSNFLVHDMKTPKTKPLGEKWFSTPEIDVPMIIIAVISVFKIIEVPIRYMHQIGLYWEEISVNMYAFLFLAYYLTFALLVLYVDLKADLKGKTKTLLEKSSQLDIISEYVDRKFNKIHKG